MTNEIRNSIDKKIEVLTSQINMIKSAPSIERCNTVVAFENGTHVATDSKGKPVISVGNLATQFEPKTAQMIVKNVKNGHSESPVTMKPIDFYERELARTKESLQSI